MGVHKINEEIQSIRISLLHRSVYKECKRPRVVAGTREVEEDYPWEQRPPVLKDHFCLAGGGLSRQVLMYKLVTLHKNQKTRSDLVKLS